MPHFRLETNVPRSKIPSNFQKEMIELIAGTLEKSTKVTAVTIVPDQLIAFGEVGVPCAEATLMSIGKLSREENVKHTKVIFDKVTKDLGIAPTKFRIQFIDPSPDNIGYNGNIVSNLPK